MAKSCSSMVKFNKFNSFYTLSLKIRLLKYLFLKKTLRNSDYESINTKIIALYVRFGMYDKAIKYYEELLFENGKKEYYFSLINLYAMSNEIDKFTNLKINYKCDEINSDDFITSINKLNNTVNNNDKFEFIESYIKSKGGIPLLVFVENKGVLLKRKCCEEKELLSNQNLYMTEKQNWIKDNNPPEYIRNLYNKEQQVSLKELYQYKSPIIKATKVLPPDFSNKYVSVVNGLRNTLFQPENANRKIIFFGNSTTYSVGVSDEDTLASQVQKHINSLHENIKVENHGIGGMNLLLSMNNMVQINIKPNDIVVFFDFDEFRTSNDSRIKKIDLNKIDRGSDFFLDLSKYQCHYSPKGNEKLSQEITNKILLPELNKKNVPLDTNIDDRCFKVLDNLKYFLYKKTAQACESEEIKKYLTLLDKHKVSPELNVGSIAVNCNPITNGHMHLIKYASEKVDKLYIFVIEEDQSFFKFKDRFKLVCDSTKHIENITVLPGGKFICTELTYPDYFNKEEENEVISDASMEAWFFCEFIASKLNIKTIFLGDEPTCNVTNQYNEKMKELLPDYNINVDIIERISTKDHVISASTVRSCLKNKDFEMIRELVPNPTYLFLKEKYGE